MSDPVTATCPMCRRTGQALRQVLFGLTGGTFVCGDCYRAHKPAPPPATNDPCAHCRGRDRNTVRRAPSGRQVPMCHACAERYAP